MTTYHTRNSDDLAPTDWSTVIPDDALAPARGCLIGTLLSGLLWVVIFGGAAPLIAKALRG